MFVERSVHLSHAGYAVVVVEAAVELVCGICARI